jgi:hypothetical protein
VCGQPFGWQLQLGIASSLCFNRVFELAGVKYLSLPVPAAHGSRAKTRLRLCWGQRLFRRILEPQKSEGGLHLRLGIRRPRGSLS